MTFELLETAETENHFFLPQYGEKAERCGAIGYLYGIHRICGRKFHAIIFKLISEFIFAEDKSGMDKWVDNQKQLNSPMFMYSLDAVTDFIKEIIINPPSGGSEFETVCYNSINKKEEDIAIRFKIQTKAYCFYSIFQPITNGYKYNIYAYDNRFLLPALKRKIEKIGVEGK